MARIRSVHPGMASDEAFMSMGFPAQAGWPLLWTECDDHGMFEWKPLVLKARIFPAALIDFAILLTEWESLGCIKKVEVEGKPYGLVRNFCKYQRPKKPSYKFMLPQEHELFVGICVTVSEPVPNQLPTTPEKSPQMKEEGGKRKEERKDTRTVAKATRPSNDPKFEELKKAYPKRKGANPWKPAKRLFEKAIRDGFDPDQLIRAVRSGVGFDRDKIGTEFIPRLTTWLSEERYKDLPADDAPAVPRNGFYAAYASHELEAWEAFGRATGQSWPRDKKGGWEFPTRWPPKLGDRSDVPFGQRMPESTL